MNRRGTVCLAIFATIFVFFSGGGETRAGTPEKAGVKVENQTTPGNQKELTSIESYIFVSEKNLFHPERTDFPIPSSPQEVKKPIVRPQITLYGVTIAGGYQLASIAVGGRPLNKGEREIMGLKVGEMVGEYKLAKILPDRIVLDQTGDSFEVLLYDSKTSKRRVDVKTDNRPVTVTNPFTSPAEGPKPAQVQTATKEPSSQELGKPLAQVPTPMQNPSVGGSAMAPSQAPPGSLPASSMNTPPTASSPYAGQPLVRGLRSRPLGVQNYNTTPQNN